MIGGVDIVIRGGDWGICNFSWIKRIIVGLIVIDGVVICDNVMYFYLYICGSGIIIICSCYCVGSSYGRRNSMVFVSF